MEYIIGIFFIILLITFLCYVCSSGAMPPPRPAPDPFERIFSTIDELQEVHEALKAIHKKQAQDRFTPKGVHFGCPKDFKYTIGYTKNKYPPYSVEYDISP